MPLTPWPDHVNLNNQSAEVPGSAQDGSSGVFKNAIWDRSTLTSEGRPRSLFELFEQSVARHPSRALFMRRPLIPAPVTAPTSQPAYSTTLIPTTYAQAQARRNAIGSALLALERGGRLRSSVSSHSSPAELTISGVPHYGNNNRAKGGARRGWAVGVWSKNREEWQVVDMACHAYGLVGVSLYETLGPDVAKYITNHCPLSIIFASANHLGELLKIAPQCPSLRVIVSMDSLKSSERDVLNQWAASLGVELLEMSELEKWGTEHDIMLEPGPVKGIPEEEELDRGRIITISYTSGTTGDPKGVVLTNTNMISAAVSSGLGSTTVLTDGAEWRYMSYLPLSHIYERVVQLVAIHGDATVCFSTGDPLRILEDAQLIKPHFMPAVPRILNRIHSAVKVQMNAGGLKGALLKKAVETKIANWRATGEVKHTLYDALVFRKIRALLGGNLLYLSSGAAPLSPDVHEMLKVCLSCDVIQGYGMTETVGTCSKGIPWDVNAVGTCGMIQTCNDVKLFDVPEMGYTSKDKPYPRGEVCLKGPSIFVGYLHDPVNTKKTIDEDGWMHTGDVGLVDSAGRLSIIDRIKNVVKLSQGEYVALEKLEGIYALDPLFATLLVHGDSTRSSLVAIAVLDPAQAAALTTKVLGETYSPTDLVRLEEAIKDARVKKAVLKNLAKVSRANKVNGFEMIKGVYLTMQPLPDEAVTPTFKIKRNIAAKLFRQQIDAAYEESEGGEMAFAKL